MIDRRSAIFFIIFSLMSVQMLLGMLQARRYQNAVKDMLGDVILGVGHRKGFLRSGEILILAYSCKEDKVKACRSMRGRTIFASFRNCPEIIGMTLRQSRELGLLLDMRDMGGYRRKHHYDPHAPSKKKGALIQAVEAIELRLRDRAESAEGSNQVLSAERVA